ncbi:MAG: hypothetical protein ACRC1K_24180 [Planctomycetia bacterium]
MLKKLLALMVAVSFVAVGCAPPPAKKAPDVKTTEPAKADGKMDPKSEDKKDAPKVDAPKVDAPKVDAPKVEAPKVEAPKVEAPKADAKKS